eukprot:m51a1_g3069 hypothetical protein (785) ;mRNA; f:9630-15766
MEGEAEDTAQLAGRLAPLVEAYASTQRGHVARQSSTPSPGAQRRSVLASHPRDPTDLKDHELLTAVARSEPAFHVPATREILARLARPEARGAMLAAILPGGVRALVGAVASSSGGGSDRELLPLALGVLEALVDSAPEEAPVALRQCGAIPVLAAALAAEDEQAQLRVLAVLQRLAKSGEENRAALVRGRVTPMLELPMRSASPELKLHAVALLAYMTEGDVRAQEAATKAGYGIEALRIIAESTGEIGHLQIAAMLLCKNLANLAFKSMVVEKHVRALANALDIDSIYPRKQKMWCHDEETVETTQAKFAPMFQCAVLDVLTSLCSLETHREFFGVSGVRVLVAYLNPRQEAPCSTVQWNFAILEKALRLLLPVTSNQKNREEFVKAGGLRHLERILSLPSVFPEAVLEPCAAVLTTFLNPSERSLCRSEFTGSLTTLVINLFRLISDNVVIQRVVLHALADLIVDQSGMEQLAEAGGIKVLFRLIRSQRADVQLSVFKILIKVVHNCTCCGLIRHPDSPLKEPFEKLVHAWRHVTLSYANEDTAHNTDNSVLIHFTFLHLKTKERLSCAVSGDMIQIDVLKDKAAELINAPNSSSIKLFLKVGAAEFTEATDAAQLRAARDAQRSSEQPTPLFIHEFINHAWGSTQETIVVLSSGAVLALRRRGFDAVRPTVGRPVSEWLPSLLADGEALGSVDGPRLDALEASAAAFLRERGEMGQRTHAMSDAGATRVAVVDKGTGEAVVLEVSGDWASERTGSGDGGSLQRGLSRLFDEIRSWKSFRG